MCTDRTSACMSRLASKHLFLASVLFMAACSSRACREDVQLQVGDEFHGVSPEAVLRVSLKGHGRSVEARRSSATARFQYVIKDGGRTSRCPATEALDAAVEQTSSVKVLGTLTRKELERLQGTPSA